MRTFEVRRWTGTISPAEERSSAPICGCSLPATFPPTYSDHACIRVVPSARRFGLAQVGHFHALLSCREVVSGARLHLIINPHARRRSDIGKTKQLALPQ